MTRQRSHNDAVLPAEAGIDLSAERAALSAHDLPALRARVLEAVAAAPPMAPPQSAWFGPRGLALTAVLGFAGGYLAHGLESQLASPPREQTSPPAIVVEPASTPADPRATQPAAPPAPRVEGKPVASLPQGGPPPPPARRAARPEPEASASNLSAQLRLYERGRKALAAGRYEVASRELAAYRAAFPRGELWQEASLSLLEALLQQGEWEQARRLAGELLAEASLANRHPELLRARALAGSHLGDCELARRDLERAGAAPAEQDRVLAACDAATAKGE